MIFKLNKNMFNILKENVSDAMVYLSEIEEKDSVKFIVNHQDILEVLMLINDEIVLKGMDNQDVVNGLGLNLYKLYDEMLYQKNNQ